MTENDIEIKAEKMMDRLDRSFAAGKVTTDEYRKAVEDINNWVNDQMRRLHE